MSAVGIDVSKVKRIVSVICPFGDLVVKPHKVRRTTGELSDFAGSLKSLAGETRMIFEQTGRYYGPVEQILYDA